MSVQQATPSPPRATLCDRPPTSVAVANGSDTTGVAADTANYATALATPCKTIKGAGVKIAAFNNTNHSRDTIDNGWIYLLKGWHIWGDGSVGKTAAATWFTVTRATGLANGEARLWKTGTSLGLALVHGYDLDLYPTSADTRVVFAGSGTGWADSNRVTGDNATTWNYDWIMGFVNTYYTNNAITNTSAACAAQSPMVSGNSATNCGVGTSIARLVMHNTFLQKAASTANCCSVASATLDNVIHSYNYIRNYGKAYSCSTAIAAGAFVAVHGPAGRREGAGSPRTCA